MAHTLYSAYLPTHMYADIWIYVQLVYGILSNILVGSENIYIYVWIICFTLLQKGTLRSRTDSGYVIWNVVRLASFDNLSEQTWYLQIKFVSSETTMIRYRSCDSHAVICNQ